MDQIYDRYGDDVFWQRVIDKFYEVTLSDPLLRDFFIGKDVNRIKSMHNVLLAAALKHNGGHFPISVLRVHKSLNISEEIFNRYLNYYSKTLKDFGISSNDIETIVNVIIAFKSDLVHA